MNVFRYYSNLTPKGECVEISSLSTILKSNVKVMIKSNYRQFKKLQIFKQILLVSSRHWKRTENSVKNMKTKVKVRRVKLVYQRSL